MTGSLGKFSHPQDIFTELGNNSSTGDMTRWSERQMLSLINSTRSFHICRVVSQMPISLHMFKGTSEQLRAMNIFDLWGGLRPAVFSSLVVCLAFRTRILGGEGQLDGLLPVSVGQKDPGAFQVGQPQQYRQPGPCSWLGPGNVPWLSRIAASRPGKGVPTWPVSML